MKRNGDSNVTDNVLKDLESYDTEKLRSSKGQNCTEQTFFCEYCMRTCFQNARGTKHYCSSACKQRALRARQGRGWQEDDYREVAAEKAIETKRDQLISRTCPQCGMYFHINGLQHRKRFCGPACKMAYHRRYNAMYAKWDVQRTNDAPKPVALTDEEKIYKAWSGALDSDTENSFQKGSNFNESD